MRFIFEVELGGRAFSSELASRLKMEVEEEEGEFEGVICKLYKDTIYIVRRRTHVTEIR